MLTGRHPLIEARVTETLIAAAPGLHSYFARRAARDDVDDLLSETLTTAWRRRGSLPSEAEQARMWLFGIARLVLANARRAERRRGRLSERLRSREPRVTGLYDVDYSEVRAAIAELQPEAAELVRLVHWEGFSVSEAAQILGLNPSTARGRYSAAKQKLRSALRVEQATPGRP